MGRITVFTIDHCCVSARVKDELKRRQLPFVEINLSTYPDRLNHAKALTRGQASLPQVFFNDSYVGGMEETLKALDEWSENFLTVIEAFEKEVASAPDPVHPKLAIPDVTSSLSTGKKAIEPVDFPYGIETLVAIPDGTKTTVMDIVERLRNSLPLQELQTKSGVWYNSTFTANSAIKTFKFALNLSEGDAAVFLQYLIKVHIINYIENGCDGVEIYRLQCHTTPDVLNTYKLCSSKPQMAIPEAVDLITRLDQLLTTIEMQSLDPVTFKVDCVKAVQHAKFAVFEDAICDLQRLNLNIFFPAYRQSLIDNRSDTSKTRNYCNKADSKAERQRMHDEYVAFALNVYRVMLRYGFLKCGIPTTNADRLQFLATVRFQVGGYYYSFQDWLDGILRGNRSVKGNGKPWFSTQDGRLKFTLDGFFRGKNVDVRVHFALAVGPLLGGGNCSLPFSTFTGDKLDEQLNIAASVFCSDETHVQINGSSALVALSKTVFGRYTSDFAQCDAGLLLLLADYLNPAKKRELKALIEMEYAAPPKISFIDMDLTRNYCNSQPYEKDALMGRVKGLKAFLKRFVPSKRTPNEMLRLETLRRLRILDTLAEERFDRITRMAIAEFGVAIVFVTLVDENRQWYKSAAWACPNPDAPTETGRDMSFCGHTIQNAPGEVLYIPNTLEDDRFADNPAVTGGFQVRFYAGYPLSIPASSGMCQTKDRPECAPECAPQDDDGSDEENDEIVNIGTLCLVDTVPRTLTDAQLDKLRDYGKMVEQEILRLDNREQVEQAARRTSFKFFEATTEAESSKQTNVIFAK